MELNNWYERTAITTYKKIEVGVCYPTPTLHITTKRELYAGIMDSVIFRFYNL